MKNLAKATIAVVIGLGSAAAASAQCSGAITQVLSVVTGNCDLDKLHDAVGDPLNQLNPFQRPSVPLPAPAPFPVAFPGQAPMPMQPPPPPPPIIFGARCMTNVGVSGYGPLNPVGSFCTWSPFPGQVFLGTVIQ